MPKLNNNQLKQLAEFTTNLGLVFIASVVTPLFTNIDKIDILTVVLGIGLMLICLTASMLLLKK